MNFRPGLDILALALSCFVFSSCSTTSSYSKAKKRGDRLVVSVDDQRLVVLDDGRPVKSYPVSTSKFGLGSRAGSNYTPLGSMYVYQKIGGGARSGTVFKSRRPTGEVLRPNTPGRDPIVSRILWLEGKERSNSNTKERTIYIHGTPEESSIGRPASYGCIRMKSSDVIDLYDRIGVGADVYVKRNHLASTEIPGSDRYLIAAARKRESGLSPMPSFQTFPGRGPAEILAASAPQRSGISTRVQPRPPAPRVVQSRVVQSRPPAPQPKAQSSRPARRGAFSPKTSDTR